MFDKLRQRMVDFLACQQLGLLCLAVEQEAMTTPVAYHSEGLQVECLLPRWTDAAYFLERPRPVVFVVVAEAGRWLHLKGMARQVARPDWAVWPAGPLPLAEMYHVVRLKPHRLELVDERRGWGAREILLIHQAF